MNKNNDFCPVCGTANYKYRSQCSHCGANLKDSDKNLFTRKSVSPAKSVRKKTPQFNILLVIFVLGIILIIGIVGAMISINSNSQTQPTQTMVPAENSDTQNSSSVSGYTDAEAKYRQWLKEDYQSWENAKTSSELYNLYQAAQSVTTPEKYKEFHQHYVKDYYYSYMAQKAAENYNANDTGYYSDLASEEYNKMCESMPDYPQLIGS